MVIKVAKNYPAQGAIFTIDRVVSKISLQKIPLKNL